MSVAITIRRVPEPIRDELAGRAARSGKSLQEFLLAELTDMALRPSLADAMASARNHARLAGFHLETSQILADRDADR